MRERADVPRRGLTIFALAIVAVFGALAVTTALSGRIDMREGSVERNGPPIGITRTLDSYLVVYRVETGDADDRNVSTERVEVRRPFESRIETFSDPPPGTRAVAVRTSTVGRLETGSGSSDPTSLVVPVTIASGDIRFDPVLEAAFDAGVIERRERREVFGRTCQVYRAGAPVTPGDLHPLTSGDDPPDYTDFCIDASGLLLEEFWVSGGQPLRRRVAIEVTENPDLADDRFAEFREGGGPQGGVIGFVERHDASWEIEPPDGFEHVATYVVAAPDLRGPGTEAPVGIGPPQMQTDLFVRGPDAVIVDQDPSLASIVGRTGQRHVTRATIEGFGEAEVVWDFRSSEIRVATPDDSVVRISATLAPDELIALARTLHQPRSAG